MKTTALTVVSARTMPRVHQLATKLQQRTAETAKIVRGNFDQSVEKSLGNIAQAEDASTSAKVIVTARELARFGLGGLRLLCVLSNKAVNTTCEFVAKKTV